MSLLGIGTDIVCVDRIKNSLKNKKFIKRVFNKKEIFKCKNIKTKTIVLLKGLLQRRHLRKL